MNQVEQDIISMASNNINRKETVLVAKAQIHWIDEDIIETAKALCQKFINKVETGRAQSKETYQECKRLLYMIELHERGKKADENRGN